MNRTNERADPSFDNWFSDDSSDEEFDINNSDNESSDESGDDSDADVGLDDEGEDCEEYTWNDIPPDFVSLHQLPERREPETSIGENDTRTDIFFKLFPKSLFMWICDCTNQR